MGIRKEEDTLLVWHGGNVGYAPILLPPNCVMDEHKVAALPPIKIIQPSMRSPPYLAMYRSTFA